MTAFPALQDPVGRQRERLEAALITLGDDWVILTDLRIDAPPDRIAVDYLLLHPDHGAALVSFGAMRTTPGADANVIDGFRRFLYGRGFDTFFPGYLPIVRLTIAGPEVALAGRMIVRAFGDIPRLTIRDREWAAAVETVLISTDPEASAPPPPSLAAPAPEPTDALVARVAALSKSLPPASLAPPLAEPTHPAAREPPSAAAPAAAPTSQAVPVRPNPPARPAPPAPPSDDGGAVAPSRDARSRARAEDRVPAATLPSSPSTGRSLPEPDAAMPTRPSAARARAADPIVASAPVAAPAPPADDKTAVAPPPDGRLRAIAADRVLAAADRPAPDTGPSSPEPGVAVAMAIRPPTSRSPAEEPIARKGAAALPPGGRLRATADDRVLATAARAAPRAWSSPHRLGSAGAPSTRSSPAATDVAIVGAPPRGERTLAAPDRSVVARLPGSSGLHATADDRVVAGAERTAAGARSSRHVAGVVAPTSPQPVPGSAETGGAARQPAGRAPGVRSANRSWRRAAIFAAVLAIGVAATSRPLEPVRHPTPQAANATVAEAPARTGAAPLLPPAGRPAQPPTPPPPAPVPRAAVAAPSPPAAPVVPAVAAAPAPPALDRDRLERDLALVFKRFGCNELEAQIADDGAVTLSGFVSRRDDLARLTREVAAQPQVKRVDSRAGVEPLAFCELSGVLRSRTASGPTIPQIEVSHADRVYRGGDTLTLAVTTHAPGTSFLYVDFFDSTGEVVHMLPTALRPGNRMVSGERVGIGASPATAGHNQRIYVVAPPFGTGRVVAFSSPRPLFDGPRPERESAKVYLAALARVLSDAAPGASAPPDVSATQQSIVLVAR